MSKPSTASNTASSSEKLIEVTAVQTFQCLVKGEVLKVSKDTTASIPEAEAKAAAEAGVIQLPSESAKK